jgi:hypothetical protein
MDLLSPCKIFMPVEITSGLVNIGVNATDQITLNALARLKCSAAKMGRWVKDDDGVDVKICEECGTKSTPNDEHNGICNYCGKELD